MSVKLTLLKSGETLISDLKEVVADVNQDKPTAFLLENPHIVDTKKKEGGKLFKKSKELTMDIIRDEGIECWEIGEVYQDVC